MKIKSWKLFTWLILTIVPIFQINVLFAQSHIELGLDGTAFHDSNPTLYPDSYENLLGTTGFLWKPYINWHFLTNQNEVKCSFDYWKEQMRKKMDPQEMTGYSFSINWSNTLNDTLTFNLINDFKESEIERENVDLPEYTGKTRWNELQPGIAYQYNDIFEAETHAFWRIKKCINSDSALFPERFIRENWDEYGASASFHYNPIQEIGFYTNLTHLKRKFRHFDPVPAQIRSNGSFGFQTLLPYGTKIRIQASIFVFEFKGDVPRRMKAEYTNFGIEFKVDQPLRPDWLINLEAKSIYDISERGARYFFHIENVSARLEYQGDKPPLFSTYIRYSKLDYLGQEPHFVEYETLAGISAGIRFNQYIRVNCFYNYFKRTQYSSEFDTDANRFGLEIKLKYDSPVGR